ncbi:MAG: hypothetical protein KDH17_05730 [Rhodocyclaceae bacterium]|nr:hypothetical protein [Rhodocyclaceae bacterium]
MTDREEETGFGMAFGAAAGMVLLSLAMLLVWDAGDDAQHDVPPRVSGLSTMTGVLALDADRGTTGIRAQVLKRPGEAPGSDAGGRGAAPARARAAAGEVASPPAASR